MQTNDRTITLRLPGDVLDLIAAQAEAEGRTLSDMVRRCLMLGLSRSHSLAKVRKGPTRKQRQAERIAAFAERQAGRAKA